jgi:type IV pilus assembly protein PilO
MDLGLDKLQPQLEKLSKLPRAYRLAILPLVAALLVLGYWQALYGPARDSLVRAEKQTLEAQRKLNEARAVAANLGKFQEEIETLEKQVAVALRQLPNDKELPVLLTDISSLGKGAGLDFESFKPKEEVPRDFYAEVPIEIQFKGSYHEVARFFDDIAKLPRIVNVNDIEMSVAKESLAETTLEVKGSAVTFRFLDQPVAPVAPKKPAAPARRAPAARRGGQA